MVRPCASANARRSPQVGIAIGQGLEVLDGHNSERADGRQRARLRLAQQMRALPSLEPFTRIATRQVEMAAEQVAAAQKKTSLRILGARVVALGMGISVVVAAVSGHGQAPRTTTISRCRV